MFSNVAIDDLYQKIAWELKLKLLRYIGIKMVLFVCKVHVKCSASFTISWIIYKPTYTELVANPKIQLTYDLAKDRVAD